LTQIAGVGFQKDATRHHHHKRHQRRAGVRSTQAVTFGTNSSTIQIRQDFTKNLINTLQTGSDQLILADQNRKAPTC